MDLNGRIETSLALAEVEAAIRRSDPELDPESPEFRTAVVLMSAALVVGPRVDLLVQFTGYPMTFVADIAHQMWAYKLWSDDEVSTDGWFEGDKVAPGFWLDCLVAEGSVEVRATEGGEKQYRAKRVN